VILFVHQQKTTVFFEERRKDKVLNNLKRVLDDKGITIRAFAKVLEVDERTVQNKIKGKTPFTYPEVLTAKKELFPEYDMEYLFRNE
jgi:hypothetical protein